MNRKNTTGEEDVYDFIDRMLDGGCFEEKKYCACGEPADTSILQLHPAISMCRKCWIKNHGECKCGQLAEPLYGVLCEDCSQSGPSIDTYGGFEDESPSVAKSPYLLLISELGGIPPKEGNLLEGIGITTVYDLVKRGRKRLLELPNIGIITVDTIEGALEQVGVNLPE